MDRHGFAHWFRFCRRLAVGLVLAYVSVVLTLGGTPAARWVLYSLAVSWLVLLVVSCQLKVDSSFLTTDNYQLPTFFRWLEIAATNVVVTLVLAELALQIWSTVAGGSLLVRANLDAHRLAPGHDYGAGLIGNRLGYPGPELPVEKKPGILRIAALGDSFAVGPAVPFADDYLTRLTEEIPNFEVGNFGVSGAGPREYLEILERDVWPVQPDMVLLSIFVGNDVTESLPRPRSLDPRHHALYLLLERGWKLAHASQPSAKQNDEEPPQRLAASPLSPQAFREVEARRLEVCLIQESTSMAKKWRRALADLDSIVQSCNKHGVVLMVVLIPDEFQVNEIVLVDALATSGRGREEIDLELPQRRLKVYFEKLNVPCLDLLSVFRESSYTYASCDTHWNVAGNHLAAREISAWISRIGPN